MSNPWSCSKFYHYFRIPQPSQPWDFSRCFSFALQLSGYRSSWIRSRSNFFYSVSTSLHSTQYLIILIICLYYSLSIYSTFWTTTFACIPVANIIYSVVLSLLNSKKALIIQQLTMMLRKNYHTGLNKIKYGYPSTYFKHHWTKHRVSHKGELRGN